MATLRVKNLESEINCIVGKAHVGFYRYSAVVRLFSYIISIVFYIAPQLSKLRHVISIERSWL